MTRGDAPVIVYEDEYFITLYTLVSKYELCTRYQKKDDQSTLLFKQEYLSNPRVIFPIREVSPSPKINVEVEEQYGYTHTGPGATELGYDVPSPEDEGGTFDIRDSDEFNVNER